jgi:hypothetical protein
VGTAFYENLMEDTDLRPCDKSLTNVHGARILADFWRDSQFLLLSRHLADFLDSSLRASPWGLSGYGFDGYAQGSPNDSLTALTRLWIERIESMRLFRATEPSRCLLVRYEDLVIRPEDEMTRISDFLGEASVQNFDRAFSRGPQRDAPQDHKFRFTAGVSSENVGSGLKIPFASSLQSTLLNLANFELQNLGYKTIAEDWGIAFGSSEEMNIASPMVEGDPSPQWLLDDVQPLLVAPRLEFGVNGPDAHATILNPAIDPEELFSVLLVMTRNARPVWSSRVTWKHGEDPSGNAAIRTDVSEDDAKTVNGLFVASLEAMFAAACGYIEYPDAFRRGDFRCYELGDNEQWRRVGETHNVALEVARLMTISIQTLGDGIHIGEGVLNVGEGVAAASTRDH